MIRRWRGRLGVRGKCLARADAARRRRAEAAAATAALLATLPQVDPRELHTLGEALAPATVSRSRPSSTASIAGSEKSCALTMPMRICRALHGWLRYGKRSSAPRATPKPTIWSESRWFSRCSGCSRKQRDRAPHDINPDNSFDVKGIRRGEATRKLRKSARRRRKAPRRVGQEGARKAAAKKRAAKKAQEEGCEECEEGWQEGCERKSPRRPSRRLRRRQPESREESPSKREKTQFRRPGRRGRG